jgi:hypothetical protein
MSAFHPLRTFRADATFRAMLPFLLALAAPSSALPTVERLTPQEAAERVSQCGLGLVTTHYERDLQEDVLVASGAQSATDEQLACAYKVVGFFYTLELPPNVQPRFDAMLEAKADLWMKAQARDWLTAKSLFDRVPKYQKGITDDGAFTREVEALCGPQAKGAFGSKYGPHVLSPQWIKKVGLPPSAHDTDAMSCIFNVTAFAGFELGFIGNEYYHR